MTTKNETFIDPERKDFRNEFTANKGGNKQSQKEIENPPTVVTTDNQKAASHVKEKGSNTRKD